MKEEFINLLKDIDRPGMDKLLEFLEKSDFFTAPASTRFHGSRENGLVEHSLKVYEILKEKIKHAPIPIDIPDESVRIIALLHDICKTNFYKIEYRNVKNSLGVWEKAPYYTIEDTIPYGHGEKSVMMIEEYIKLTPQERYSIRWHMGPFSGSQDWGTLGVAFEKYPLALALFEADMEATHILEKEA